MNYLIMFAGGMLGIILHVLFKVKAMNKRLDQETYGSVFKEYWHTDWVVFLISVFVVLTCMFISSEYLNIQEDSPETPIGIVQTLQYKIEKFVKSVFVVIGFAAEYFVYATLGRAEKKLKKKAEEE